MEINKGKSGIMFLEDKNCNKIEKKYKQLNLEGYPIIHRYKYLGVVLDNNMNLKFNTSYLIGKLWKNQKILQIQK